MAHSAKFEKVKNYYIGGYWTIKMVKNAVDKSWITKAEYKEITGETYEEG